MQFGTKAVTGIMLMPSKLNMSLSADLMCSLYQWWFSLSICPHLYVFMSSTIHTTDILDENISNIVINIMAPDDLALYRARTSACSKISKFWMRSYPMIYAHGLVFLLYLFHYDINSLWTMWLIYHSPQQFLMSMGQPYGYCSMSEQILNQSWF